MKKLLLVISLLLFTASLPGLSAAAQAGRLSTHVLDISRGQPASDIQISLYAWDEPTRRWTEISAHKTDDNGRVADLLTGDADRNGTYKLRFETAAYFKARNQPSIYPYIEVVFQIDGKGHYHIPITVSANGYSTYRGS